MSGKVMAEQGSQLIRTLSEHANYPAHPVRKPTKLYTANHHRMVVVENRGCLKCHVRHSDLENPTRRLDATINPMGSLHMELHHHLCEDSLANAVHLPYFNAHVRPGLLRQAQAYKLADAEDFETDFTQEQMVEFIHGHELNLMPLCDRHHRHPLIGAHSITGPIWDVQDMLIPGFDLTGFHAYTPQEAAQLTALPLTTGTAQVLNTPLVKEEK